MLVLACVVVPIDFAPSERVVRDRRLSARVRSGLNVEGGYNDGIVSPIFLFALVLAGGNQHSVNAPAEALATALPFTIKALLVGLVLGTLLGWLLDRCSARGWTTDQSRRIVVLLAPVLTYAVAVAINGNGFVAAFVCGIFFRYVHRVLVARRLHRAPDGAARSARIALVRDFALIEDVTTFLTMAMWFVVGIAGIFLISSVDLWVVVFCVLVLTVLRIVPVYVSTLGTSLGGRDRVLLGLLGPRGTTTIVFGLLAFNGLPDGPVADTILITTVLCVVASVLLHGIGSGPAISRFTRPRPPGRVEVSPAAAPGSSGSGPSTEVG
jgi:NhaP-type Na+/H+ or K+/H+ antiporter